MSLRTPKGNSASAESQTGTTDVTLLTGAASGIGRALASEFVRHGHDLALVDIDPSGLDAVENRLESAPGTVRKTIVTDLTKPTAPDRIDQRLTDSNLRVSTLVNNAGVPVYGQFTETEWEDERAMIQLNVEAVTALADRFVPRMVERGDGRVLNTASLAALVPVPTAAVYGATKSYVLSFSLALATELEATGVTVTALCPGETDTGFITRGGMEQSAFESGGDDLMKPSQVAAAGYSGVMAGKRIVVPGWKNRFRYHLSRFLPRSLGARLTRDLWSGEK